MVKRAVGSKACLLGKAVTCKYLRQDNFLEVTISFIYVPVCDPTSNFFFYWLLSIFMNYR